MFPLLPAILLLLLNGPSGLDRIGQDACLPEAIKALHRQIHESGDGEPKSKLLKGIQQELIIASLLAGTSDDQLSQALSDLLLLVGMADLAPPPTAIEPIEQPPNRALRIPEPYQSRLAEGLSQTARSRDGPLSR